MEVEEKELGTGEAGITLTVRGQTFIVVNTSDDPYRKRFTILHELAHHVLALPSNHSASFASNELGRFAGRPPEERICDVFAAECLVPYHLLRPLVSTLPFTVAVLHELCEKFEASRPCVASSFVRASKEMLAYVYAEGGKVQNVVASPALRDAKVFVDRGPLPKTSAAAKSLSGKTRSTIEEIDAIDWSSSDQAADYVCIEEAFAVPAWRQTHSLLTFEQATSSRPGRMEIDREDELLPELTGHLSWTKRR
jgi:hypothetical protein